MNLLLSVLTTILGGYDDPSEPSGCHTEYVFLPKPFMDVSATSNTSETDPVLQICSRAFQCIRQHLNICLAQQEGIFGSEAAVDALL